MAASNGSWLEGLHIPLIQGEQVYGALTNITITIIVFAFIVLTLWVIARYLLKHNKKSKLKLFFLTFTKFFDDQLRDAFDGDKKKARQYYPLIVGMFFLIFFGNLFGLVIDWFGMSILPDLLYYMRPMHSDLNTTLVLSLVTVVYMLKIQINSQWWLWAIKSYIFNFSGENFMSKCINVFVGWLHAIGIFATTASLALRLFWNIFAGLILIWVVTALLASATGGFFEIGRLAVIPLWFFECFVALIQAIVFTYLMIAYFKGASEHH